MLMSRSGQWSSPGTHRSSPIPIPVSIPAPHLLSPILRSLPQPRTCTYTLAPSPLPSGMSHAARLYLGRPRRPCRQRLLRTLGKQSKSIRERGTKLCGLAVCSQRQLLLPTVMVTIKLCLHTFTHLTAGPQHLQAALVVTAHEAS